MADAAMEKLIARPNGARDLTATARRERKIARSGEPYRIRTCDPLIKSQLLYQLSYGPTINV